VALGSFLKSVDLEYDVISVASKFSYLFWHVHSEKLPCLISVRPSAFRQHVAIP
jgi:hypothetical protein